MSLNRVRWAELLPDEFLARRHACPLVYLPVGLCEPHGHVAALGLDLIKADYYCDEAAQRFGGIVAPSQGYHIHECGFHAPWLAEVVGNVNPLMAALPPQVMLYHFLYQLRAFANAGFRAAIVTSGHAGGSQEDLRRVAALFTARTRFPVIVKTDPEWVEGLFEADHAGKYEISQLLAIRPDLVNLRLSGRQHAPDSGGRFGIGLDTTEATAEYGRTINEAILTAVGREVTRLTKPQAAVPNSPYLDYGQAEAIWATVCSSMSQWRSLAPYPTQPAISENSMWKNYARPLPGLLGCS